MKLPNLNQRNAVYKQNGHPVQIWKSIFQVVRLKLENDRRIVGTLIPSSAMSALTTALEQGSQVIIYYN